MVMAGQNPYPELGDGYLTDKISSFSLRALPLYGTKTIPSWIMATTGNAVVKTSEFASYFDHDFEKVTPYFSSLILEDYKITIGTTVTEHTSSYQFSFPKSTESNILLGYNSRIKVVGNNAVEAAEYMGKGQKAYFYAVFSRLFSTCNTWRGVKISPSNEQVGDSIGVVAYFTTTDDEKIEVKVGVSYIDVEQAKKNLTSDIPDWNFETTKNKARNVWNELLGRIKIEGGTEEERVKFYSALYRVMLGNQSVNLTECGRYFSRFDSTVHNTNGHDFYRVDSNWVSHHSFFPLFLFLEPDKQNDMLRSYARMEEQGGWSSQS
jgi:putative alpha-1,2-mannosidase